LVLLRVRTPGVAASSRTKRGEQPLIDFLTRLMKMHRRAKARRTAVSSALLKTKINLDDLGRHHLTRPFATFFRRFQSAGAGSNQQLSLLHGFDPPFQIASVD
jgi:hypothetical protein